MIGRCQSFPDAAQPCCTAGEAFVESGGLDPDFFAYLDDLDLALRVHLLGYGGLYLPDAVAYHIGSATLGETLHPRVIEYITRNQIYLLTKDYPAGSLSRGCCRESWPINVMWALFAIRKGGFAAYLRGLQSRLQRPRQHATKARRTDRKASHRRRRVPAEAARLRTTDLRLATIATSRRSESWLLNIYFRLFGRS